MFHGDTQRTLQNEGPNPNVSSKGCGLIMCSVLVRETNGEAAGRVPDIVKRLLLSIAKFR